MQDRDGNIYCGSGDPDDMDSGSDLYVGFDEYLSSDEDMGPEYWQQQLGDAADHDGVEDEAVYAAV